ncbi:MAG: 4-hydroxybenzoate octaprenyltransferase [Bacteroidota bacterium]
MEAITKYFKLVKFSHTIFALPFAVVGFFLGIENLKSEGSTDHNHFYTFLLMLGCMVTARSSAMAFNRYADRKFDAKNARTKNREIPSGLINEKSALLFVIVNSILFVVCTYFINSLCFYLSPVALLVILSYSFMKRFTSLCHIVLGLGLSLAPIGSFLSVTGKFQLIPILLSLSVLFWVSGFDIIYALQDESFDRENNLHSIPVLLGRKSSMKLSSFFHLTSSSLIFFTGYLGSFNWLYWIGASLFFFFLIYQHSLVKENDLSKVNLAFFTMNGIASIVFGLITIISLFLI